jgi:tRNA dimethylallyltransferase
MRAHGVPGLLAQRRGEVTLSEAIGRGQADTRAYAKRQWTWARTQLPTFLHVAPERAFETIMASWEGGSVELA